MEALLWLEISSVYKTGFELVQGVGPPEVYLLLGMFPL